MSEVRVYLGDDDTYDLACNCTVKIGVGDNIVLEISVEELLSYYLDKANVEVCNVA
jgi:hypothetical protein